MFIIIVIVDKLTHYMYPYYIYYSLSNIFSPLHSVRLQKYNAQPLIN